MIKPTYGHLLVRLVADERHGIDDTRPRDLPHAGLEAWSRGPIVCGELVTCSEIDSKYWTYPAGTKLFFAATAIQVIPPASERLAIVSEAAILAYIKPKGPTE